MGTRSQEEQEQNPLLSPTMEARQVVLLDPGGGTGSWEEVQPAVGTLSKVGAGEEKRHLGFPLPLTCWVSTSCSQ